MRFLLRSISVFLVLFMLLPIARNKGEAYDVRDPENCALHFAVLSDCHIEGNNYMRFRVFAESLRDVRRNESGNDAVVFLGDNTMNGQAGENMIFHGGVRLLLPGETVLPVVGNHDLGNGRGDYARLQKRWFRFTEAFFDRKLTVPYYYTVIGGSYFIVLGMEAQEVYAMPMTDAQFAWLEGVLAAAAESGKPAFVFAHYPSDAAADESGAYTGRLTELLAGYANEHDLFSFVGHTHMSFGMRSFRSRNGFPETYLPRLTELFGENDDEPGLSTGIGVEVEVYEDEVLIRGRNYYYGEWLADRDDGTPIERSYPLH